MLSDTVNHCEEGIVKNEVIDLIVTWNSKFKLQAMFNQLPNDPEMRKQIEKKILMSQHFDKKKEALKVN